MTPSFRLWPQGFTGRVTLVLLLAVVAQFAAVSLLVGSDEAGIKRQDLSRKIAEQLLVAERLIESAAPADQAAVVSTLSTNHLEIGLVEGEPPAPVGTEVVPADIADAIIAWEPALAEKEMRLAISDSPGFELRRTLNGALDIGEGRWLVFRTLEPVDAWVLAFGATMRVAAVALMVLATAALLVRTLSTPLKKLSDNSQLIGTRQRIHFEELRGPRELRRLSSALNEMQDRIANLITQRTDALAAVGHDLRTPLARLRLRLSELSDPEERAAAEQDIAVMSRMLQELHDYYEAGDVAEDFRPVDLASLCRMICETFEDLGSRTTYTGPEKLVIPAQYDLLRRAIENLVDNAVKYGGGADLVLAQRADRVTIEVSDEGPGVPADGLQRILEPFERLDSARGTKHPGMGLGLAIALDAVTRNGGTLSLRNREPHGLAATIEITVRNDPSNTL